MPHIKSPLLIFIASFFHFVFYEAEKVVSSFFFHPLRSAWDVKPLRNLTTGPRVYYDQGTRNKRTWRHNVRKEDKRNIDWLLWSCQDLAKVLPRNMFPNG